MKSGTIKIIFSLFIIAAVLEASPQGRLRKASLENLSTKAHHVSLIRCLDSTAIHSRAGNMIFTLYRFQSVEQIAGKSLPLEFTLRVAGGVIGQSKVVVHGAPRFEKGRAYAVFLRPKKSGDKFLVSGADQGVFPAYKDKETGEWMIAINGVHHQKHVDSSHALASTHQTLWVSLPQFQSMLHVQGGESK